MSVSANGLFTCSSITGDKGRRGLSTLSPQSRISVRDERMKAVCSKRLTVRCVTFPYCPDAKNKVKMCVIWRMLAAYLAITAVRSLTHFKISVFIMIILFISHFHQMSITQFNLVFANFHLLLCFLHSNRPRTITMSLTYMTDALIRGTANLCHQVWQVDRKCFFLCQGHMLLHRSILKQQGISFY